MSFEEEWYNYIVQLHNENKGFTFLPQKLRPKEELLPEEKFMLRALFFYHIKAISPKVVNSLYDDVFPHFQNIYTPFIEWYKEKFKRKKEFIYQWSLVKVFKNDDFIEAMEKWGEKYNLAYEWIYNANMMNMSAWILYPKHKDNKTWVYSVPIFLTRKQENEKFINQCLAIAEEYNIPQMSDVILIPKPHPEVEGLTDYKKRLANYLKKQYKLEEKKLKNLGYKKPYEKNKGLNKHFEWLVLSQIEGLTLEEIMYEEDTFVEMSNISHNINDLRDKLGLRK